MKQHRPYRLIISGGGTGGHLFPAIAIALHFKELHPDVDILFVGAKGKMEMLCVPQAGFKIVGLRVSGLNRQRLLPNLLLPFKFIFSMFKAGKLLSAFRPDIVIGTGGYTSAPVALAAGIKGIPVLVHEQNSYAGLANKWIARRATTICVAYNHMSRYFPNHEVVLTGNPVQNTLFHLQGMKQEALDHFSFSSTEHTILILGGSLGAKTINESILLHLDRLIEARVQVLWQTGKRYYDDVKEQLAHKNLTGIRFYDFIQRMDLAYSISNVVISRSGALTISELCATGKASILVPSPNVAEDHQTKNAKVLVEQDAAIMIKDSDARNTMIDKALKLIHDRQMTDALSAHIRRLGKPNATRDIVREIENIITCN